MWRNVWRVKFLFAAELNQLVIDPCISLAVFNFLCLTGNLSDDTLVGENEINKINCFLLNGFILQL
jgi:hypothetical protein